MYKLLIVRPYRYYDERQQLIEEINEMWNILPMPDGVRIVHKLYPEKVTRYNGSERLYPFVWRCWVALQEWLKTPAEWVCISDADVTPLRRDALYWLLSEINNLPSGVKLVAPSYLEWLHKWKDYWRCALSSEGLCIGAPDGLHTIHHSAMLFVVQQYHHYSGYVRNAFFPPEPAYACTLTRHINVRCFPPHILTVLGVWDTSVNLLEWGSPPAFAQFVGDLRFLARQVKDAWVLLNR